MKARFLQIASLLCYQANFQKFNAVLLCLPFATTFSKMAHFFDVL